MSYLHDASVSIPSTPTATLSSSQTIPILELDGTVKHTTNAALAAFLKTNLIGIDPITTPVASATYTIQGPYVNFTPTSLQFSTNGGTSWTTATSPTIGSNHYSFTAPGLASGTYNVWVRDTTQTTVIGVHPAFVVA
jgi:hypothetical protein